MEWGPGYDPGFKKDTYKKDGYSFTPKCKLGNRFLQMCSISNISALFWILNYKDSGHIIKSQQRKTKQTKGRVHTMEDIYEYEADQQAEYDMIRKDEETHYLYQDETYLTF